MASMLSIFWELFNEGVDFVADFTNISRTILFLGGVLFMAAVAALAVAVVVAVVWMVFLLVRAIVLFFLRLSGR